MKQGGDVSGHVFPPPDMSEKTVDILDFQSE